jgi:hypothetical protein
MEARCCMPPDSCQGNFFSKPESSTSSRFSARSRCSPWQIAHDFQRQRDIVLDGAPGIERRRLEHIAIGAVEAGLFRRHALDGDRPAGGLSRSAMTRRRVVLPQPDGPISETNSPLCDVEIDIRQRMHRTVIGLEGQIQRLGRR